MSTALKIDLNELRACERDLVELGAELQGDELKRVIGRSIANLLRDHFTDLANDSAHHRTAESLGAAPTGFYSEAVSGVQQPEIETDGVSVSINKKGLAQRLFGGTITAPEGKMLTIPARTEAYGKRADEFNNLKVIMFASGSGALVQTESTVLRGGKRGSAKTIGVAGARKGDSIGGLIVFWLVKQVTQQEDPSVLPTQEELGNAAVRAARSFVGQLRFRTMEGFDVNG